jgi:lipoprotein-releasing system ATP-binding protein
MSIEVHQITKVVSDPPVTILKQTSLTIDDGAFLSISGRSGSGKSTLLYILSTLDLPTSGHLLIDGKDPARMSEKELHEFRSRQVGYIFQFHYLLPELTAIENVLFPARNHHEHIQREPLAKDLLERFGLARQMHKLPGHMSGGEQQRVAIARALIMNPKYIFADEPTGSLDTNNGLAVMNILKEVNHQSGSTVVLVTHEREYALMAQREITLSDGEMIADELINN